MFQGFAFLPAVDGAYWTLTVELAFYMCMVGLWAVFGLRHIERLLFGWLAIKWLWWMVPDLPERIVMVLLLRYVGFFAVRSEEHTSELQSLMRISYAVFCLKKKNRNKK